MELTLKQAIPTRIPESYMPMTYSRRTAVKNCVAGILDKNTQRNNGEDISNTNNIQMVLMEKSGMEPIEWIVEYSSKFREIWNANIHSVGDIELALYRH